VSSRSEIIIFQSNVNVYFRSNPKDPHELFDDDEYSIHNSFFSPERYDGWFGCIKSFLKLFSHDFRFTFVLTHGYLEHGNKDWIVKMKDEFLKHGDHNVIIVSWLGGSRSGLTLDLIWSRRWTFFLILDLHTPKPLPTQEWWVLWQLICWNIFINLQEWVSQKLTWLDIALELIYQGLHAKWLTKKKNWNVWDLIKAMLENLFDAISVLNLDE